MALMRRSTLFMRPAPPELVEFLAPFGDDVHEIVHRLHARVLEVMPGAHEIHVWGTTNTVSLVYTPLYAAPGRTVSATSRGVLKHVNLGFNDGASLADPLGVLAGTGSRIRHVTLRTAGEADAALWVEDYLRAALAHADHTSDMGDGGTTVRVPPTDRSAVRGSAAGDGSHSPVVPSSSSRVASGSTGMARLSRWSGGVAPNRTFGLRRLHLTARWSDGMGSDGSLLSWSPGPDRPRRRCSRFSSGPGRNAASLRLTA